MIKTAGEFVIICFYIVLFGITAYGLKCTEILDATTKHIECKSDGLILIKTAWWYNRQFYLFTCQRSNLKGQLDFKNDTAAQCDKRQSCDVTNKASSHSKLIVFYYCKATNCKYIPVDHPGSITCRSSKETIVIEDAWLDMDQCIKSTTTVTDLTLYMSKLCHGKTNCQITYKSEKYHYVNIRYHCRDPSKSDKMTTISTDHNYGSSTDLTTQYSRDYSTEEGLQTITSTDHVSSTDLTSQYSPGFSTDEGLQTTTSTVETTVDSQTLTTSDTNSEQSTRHQYSQDASTISDKRRVSSEKYHPFSSTEISSSDFFGISTKSDMTPFHKSSRASGTKSDTTPYHKSSIESGITQDIIPSSVMYPIRRKSTSKHYKSSIWIKTITVSSPSLPRSTLISRKITRHPDRIIGLTTRYHRKMTFSNSNLQTNTVKTSNLKTTLTVSYGQNGHSVTTPTVKTTAEKHVKSSLSTMSKLVRILSDNKKNTNSIEEKTDNTLYYLGFKKTNSIKLLADT